MEEEKNKKNKDLINQLNNNFKDRINKFNEKIQKQENSIKKNEGKNQIVKIEKQNTTPEPLIEPKENNLTDKKEESINKSMNIREGKLMESEIIDYSISESDLKEWENILLKNHSEKAKFIFLDEVIFIQELDNPDIKVIKNDVNRTRVKDQESIPEFKSLLEKYLVLYCKLTNIKYKQGLNEIFGPFLLLRARHKIEFHKIYNLTSCFIEKYLTNYYHEEEFYCLQSSLALLNNLLKYHNAVVYNIFEYSLITPQMYATSWILTIFSNKTKLDILYYFWNKLIYEDDEVFIHYFIVSLIEYYTQEIICSDLSQIPSLISSIFLKDMKMVDEIFENAKRIRALTPYSFRLFFDKMQIFKPFCNNHKQNFEMIKPDSILCLPILPSEIFYITYNNLLKCPDERCPNFIDEKELEHYNEFIEEDTLNRKNNLIEKPQENKRMYFQNMDTFGNNEENIEESDRDFNGNYLETDENIVTFQSERRNEKEPSEIYIDNKNNYFSKTSRDNNDYKQTTEEYIENLERNIGYNNKTDVNYKQEITGGFSDPNILINKKNTLLSENDEEIDKISANLENHLRKPCFFCTRNKQITSEYKLEEITNKKNYEDSLSECLKILMKSFNIENKFNDNPPLGETETKNKVNEGFLLEKFKFLNHYPKNLSFILLDLRISLDKKEKFYDFKPGFLPMTVVIEQEELGDQYFADNLTDKYIEEKEKYHFVLITSETDYFHDFENNFYSEIVSEKDKRKMLYGIQSKNYKEIDMKILKSYLAKNKSKHIQPRLKEYDNFRKLIYNFMKKKYKYVSYVFGGFDKIHEESIKFNIPLLNHDENCFLCKKKNKKTNEIFSDSFIPNNLKSSAKNFFFGKKDNEDDHNKNNTKDKNPENENNIKNNQHGNKIDNGDKIDKNEKGGFFSKLFRLNKNKSEKIIEPKKNIVGNNTVIKEKFRLEINEIKIEEMNQTDRNFKKIRASDPQIDLNKLNANKSDQEKKNIKNENKIKQTNIPNLDLLKDKENSNLLEENIYIKVESNLQDSNIFTEQILQSDANILSNLNDDNDVNKIFSMEDVSNIITNPEFTVFTCLLLEKGNNVEKVQIMIILNNSEIKIFKLIKYSSLNLDEKINSKEKDNLVFQLIENFKIEDVIGIFPKKQSKNIITIEFISSKKKKSSITADLITDIDSKTLIGKIKAFSKYAKN